MSDKYVIVQDRVETGPNGSPTIKEVLLAYPDTKPNAAKRLFKWRSILEMDNLRLRLATKHDYRKTRRKK